MRNNRDRVQRLEAQLGDHAQRVIALTIHSDDKDGAKAIAEYGADRVRPKDLVVLIKQGLGDDAWND